MNRITGVMFYYYFICHRKIWYFSKGIQLENENQDVQIGKIIDETSYQREKKHILIDDTISIDFVGGFNVIHEVKKSKSIEEAGIWQLKYYMYYLKQKGVENIKGVIDYPKLRQRKNLELSNEDEDKIKLTLKKISDIVGADTSPPVINSKICKKCAYYELCYI